MKRHVFCFNNECIPYTPHKMINVQTIVLGYTKSIVNKSGRIYERFIILKHYSKEYFIIYAKMITVNDYQFEGVFM